MKKIVPACLLLLSLSACAVSEQAKPSQVQYSGFLGNYSDLTATGNKDLVLERYINPSAAWSSYNAIRLEPVSFWAAPEEFIALAEAAGLETVRYWRHEDPNTRNNYLLRKSE